MVKHSSGNKAAGKASFAASLSSTEKQRLLGVHASDIANKHKREEIYSKQKALKKMMKKTQRRKRQRQAELLGDKAPPKQQPKTLDNTREKDETMVEGEDKEIVGEEKVDEFAAHFANESHPRIVITSCLKPTKQMYGFIKDLLILLPGSTYYARRRYPLYKIIEYSKERGFTDLLVINEDKKQFNALLHIKLPDGPTAFYRLTSVVVSSDIPGHGRPIKAHPEVILNGFNTRLGRRVGRMLGSMVHQEPHFKGRRVMTFHNQRDFIFVRHHRYIFDDPKTVRLQELGPRFTLKLQWLQAGTFDSKSGEYEWKHNPEMDTSRKRFFL